MLQTAQVYFVFHNQTYNQLHFLFKKNILRFRKCEALYHLNPDWALDKIYLQFVMRDGSKIGFFLTESAWEQFYNSLPNPPRIDVVSPPGIQLGDDGDAIP